MFPRQPPTNHLSDLVQHKTLSLDVQRHKLCLSPFATGGAAGTLQKWLATLGRLCMCEWDVWDVCVCGEGGGMCVNV